MGNFRDVTEAAAERELGGGVGNVALWRVSTVAWQARKRSSMVSAEPAVVPGTSRDALSGRVSQVRAL